MVIPKPTSTTPIKVLRIKLLLSWFPVYYPVTKNVRVSWKNLEQRKGPRKNANFTQNSPLMANLLLLLPEKKRLLLPKSFFGCTVKSNREVSIWEMVIQLPAVSPTYYQLLLNAETETWIAEIQQIFVFNIPFFGWCNRKWVVESRCQILWVWEKIERVERAEKSIQEDVENISIPNHDVQSVFVFGSNQKSKSLVWWIQNVCRVTTYRAEISRLLLLLQPSTLSPEIWLRWLLPPNTTCLTSLKISSLYFIFRRRISFFIFKRRLAAEEGSFSKKTWVQKISRGRWAPCGPGRRQWYRRGRQEAPMVGIYFLA